MATHLTEEEQLEALKRWWKDYGTAIMIAAAVGLGGFFAWNQYKSYKVEKAREASAVYEKFAAAVADDSEVTEQEAAEARRLAEEVIAQGSEGLYADFATLYLAKLAAQQQDFATAKTHLDRVINQGANESVKELARLRLARVLAAAGETDQALSILSGKPSAAYVAAYAEAKGDILLSQKRLGEARAAYESALQALGTGQPMVRNLVQLKIDSTRTSSDDPVILPQPGAANPHATNPHSSPAATAEAGDA